MSLEELKKLHLKLFNLGNSVENRDHRILFHGAASCVGIIIGNMEGREDYPIEAMIRFFNEAAANAMTVKIVEMTEMVKKLADTGR